MQITKFGQCCLLIEVAGKRILTDPGRFSVSQNDVSNIDIILITHEHADHLRRLDAIDQRDARDDGLRRDGPVDRRWRSIWRHTRQH